MNIVQEIIQEPQDLMSLKELGIKYGYNYGYLYKWSVKKGIITTYFRGIWKLSESEVLSFCKNTAEKKLKKARERKNKNNGWNK